MSLNIQINQILKKFGEVVALNHIDDSFESGKLHGLIGPEGAGKTTLLRNIMGLLIPNSGNINFSENDNSIIFSEIKSKISYMPQRQSLYPDLSIEEHLTFFKSLYGIDDSTFHKKSRELLEITRLNKFLDRPAGKLSGGMYKKLGLMLSLLQSPKVLLLDEPTNGVDPISRREFWELLNHLISDNIIIIYATSYMDEAERCDLVHLLDNGRLFSKGPPDELLEKAKVKTFDEYYLTHTKETV
jgi:ABC-2 type transport system ATP-binding protein